MAVSWTRPHSCCQRRCANGLPDVASNQLTPDAVLVLFILSVLAGAWVVATLVGYASARHSGLFVALVDLAFVTAFIAGVYDLRDVTHWDCANPRSGRLYYDLNVF